MDVSDVAVRDLGVLVALRLARRSGAAVSDTLRRAGDHDVVAFLLSVGAEPASSDEEGLNALHHAARSGHFQTISLLLETAIATRPSLVASRDTLGRNLLHHLSSAPFKLC